MVENVGISVWTSRELKNGWWSIEEGNVGRTCKDGFMDTLRGEIGRWKIAEVAKGIVGGYCKGGCRTSRVVMIELLLPNFERETTFEDSAFWWLWLKHKSYFDICI